MTKKLLSAIIATLITATFLFTACMASESTTATRYECETAAVGTSVTYKTETDATYASGGVYASNTNNVMFVYENVPQSNTITLRCAAQVANPATITLKLKKPGETEWTTVGTLTFEPTTSWNMKDSRYLTFAADIPEGSSFAHQSPTGVNYDYIEFSHVEADEVQTGRIEAENCAEDMATYGWNIQTDSNASGGQMVGNTGGKTFTYKNVPEFNRLIIPVSCQADSVVTVSVKTPSGAEAVLPQIKHLDNGGWYMNTAVFHTIDGYHFPAGSTVSLKIGHGVNLDYLDFYKVKFENASAVEAESGAASVGSFETVEAEGASGGKYISLTAGTSVEYVNISEANSIKMIYASAENGSVTVEVMENGEWINKGTIPFATMMEETVGALTEVYSDVIYIPEGAAVRITANCKLIIDNFEFIKQIAKTESELDETYLLAKNVPEASGSTVEDIMALVGTAAEITAGNDYTFTLPSTLSQDYNTLLVAYHSENEGTAAIGTKEMKLAECSTVEYQTTRIAFTQNFTAGQTIVFKTSTEGVKLDYIKLSYVTPAQAQSISALPKDAERITVSLNGTWNCQIGADLSANAATLTVPDEFDNTIPVPGFWDMASVSLGSYPGKSLWYKKVVTMPEDFDPEGDVVVRLEILRALYGRHVYINGNYVDSCLYNYIYSHSDITEYLKPGENDIVIMLGSQSGQNALETHVHTGQDAERKVYQPGITDSVNLILSGKSYTKAVQVAPDIDNGKVEIQVKLESTETASDVPVTVNFYELGVITNGTGSAGRTKVGTYTTTADVTAGAQTLVSAADIVISNFDKDTKCWAPGNPYLYEIEVVLPGDTFSKRFGMKEFHFDAETKLPILNGRVYYLRGTNIAPYRFYEDPQRGSYPWQEQWIRKIYSEFKETNWEIYRSHNGPMPVMWYDIADEVGMMVVDEYAIFGKCSKCTTETLLPEYRAMVEEKQTHASIIYWDAQNEANSVDGSTKVDWIETGDAIRQLISERIDIAERHWDNGWSNPVDEVSPVEFHPYPFISGANIDSLNTQDNTKPWNAGANGSNNVNPKIVNEYASLWLNREGEPTSISKKNYDRLIPDSTTEQRFELYTMSTACLTEFYRSGRNIAAIQQFTGLSYGKPGQEGATGDVFMPDLSDPEIRPLIKDRLKSSFAPLGIILAKYDLTIGVGDSTYPLTLVNDYNYDIENLPVTFTVTSGETEIFKETRTYSLKEAGTTGEDIVKDTFDFEIPLGTLEDKAEVNIRASYTLDGEEVYSLRTVTYDAAARSLDSSISQGKTVTVSSESTSDGNLKENAVDGDAGTRWGGEYRAAADDNYTPWICVDLGAKYDLMRMQVEWENAMPNAYEIQVSNDGTTFATVATVDAVVKNNQKIDFEATARYVKLQAIEGEEPLKYSISIFEWYIWGDPVEEVPATPANVTTGKTVTVSSESLNATNANNHQPKENAVDGDESTRWGSEYRAWKDHDIYNPWICVDMEDVYTLSSLRIKFESARPTKFYVQTSLDGINFVTANTFESPKGNAWNEYEISGTGRYLRIYADGCADVNGTVYGMSIYELEGYGVPAKVYDVSGKLELSREDGQTPYSNNPALLTVFKENTQEVIMSANIENADTTASGAEFSVSLPAGTYDYCIIKNGYLQYNGKMTVEEGKVSFGSVKLIPGDIKGTYQNIQGDGVVDIDDFVRVLRGFSEDAPLTLRVSTDINEDKFVNVIDLGIVKASFGKSTTNLYNPAAGNETLKSISDTFEKVYFLGDTDKNPMEYAVNEIMLFTVTLYGDGEVISAPYFKYDITADDGTSESGYIDAPYGEATIAASCSVPGYVRLRVYACDKDKNVVSGAEIFEGGACADFDRITQSYSEPSDFDTFWAGQLALLDSVEATASESTLVEGHSYSDFDVYDVKIPCVDSSRPVSGYVSVPKNAEAGTLKLKAVYQGYGVDSAIITCTPGYVTFYINPHGIENGKEASYYSELKAGELSGFGFSGNTPAKNSYFRNMILRDIQGVRYLKAAYAELWNGSDIEIQGGSMGAFQATAVASLLGNEATKLTINIPWMCDVGSETKGKLGGWRPSYSEGILYYDTVNFAKRVKAPTYITAGLGDYICPPSGITVLYKSLTCDKTLTFIQNKTHGYNPVKSISYTK